MQNNLWKKGILNDSKWSNHFTIINVIRGTVYDYFKGVEKKVNCLDLSKAFYLGNHRLHSLK